MHVIKLCAVGALCQLVAMTAQAQQPSTLTLACKGTTTEYLLQGATVEQPISMGIIVNLADRTVQGFGYPFDIEPLKIGYANDVEVRFGGEQETSVRSVINGSINRVTRDVEASDYFGDQKTGETSHATSGA
jgi:hypothetical protein